ncbi:hypothetical protein PFICI_05944 [Pestalotiopsis fici W106-1]|uniref:Uncharacterized protein n=1 Tax=Pestalotiopsis fici (strain W106-1 / CGMCC3.15140) TaxID=1229662 RepID=W3XD93_PESFW|nr:uncharacterized protein PFICI_05944 [Pestalotiopsis fici W106-1]ETS84068.1 hypothetical protein PFICI_05944 [Pestalotiopsis fici W106-1]
MASLLHSDNHSSIFDVSNIDIASHDDQNNNHGQDSLHHSGDQFDDHSEDDSSIFDASNIDSNVYHDESDTDLDSIASHDDQNNNHGNNAIIDEANNDPDTDLDSIASHDVQRPLTSSRLPPPPPPPPPPSPAASVRGDCDLKPPQLTAN